MSYQSGFQPAKRARNKDKRYVHRTQRQKLKSSVNNDIPYQQRNPIELSVKKSLGKWSTKQSRPRHRKKKDVERRKDRDYKSLQNSYL